MAGVNTIRCPYCGGEKMIEFSGLCGADWLCRRDPSTGNINVKEHIVFLMRICYNRHKVYLKRGGQYGKGG